MVDSPPKINPVLSGLMERLNEIYPPRVVEGLSQPAYSERTDYIYTTTRLLSTIDSPELFDLSLFVNAVTGDREEIDTIVNDISTDGLTTANKMRLYALSVRSFADIIPELGTTVSPQVDNANETIDGYFLGSILPLVIASGFVGEKGRFDDFSKMILNFTAEDLLDHGIISIVFYNKIRLVYSGPDTKKSITDKIDPLLIHLANALHRYKYSLHLSGPYPQPQVVC